MNVGESIVFCEGTSELGSVFVASTTKGICFISLNECLQNNLDTLQKEFPHSHIFEGGVQSSQEMQFLTRYIASPNIGIPLRIDPRGTPFQSKVWEAIQRIPLGHTVSYMEIAAMINSPRSVRAVARACGANKIALAIPCHRVVCKNGSLSGYRWGVRIKEMLLKKERASLLHLPIQ